MSFLRRHIGILTIGVFVTACSASGAVPSSSAAVKTPPTPSATATATASATHAPAAASTASFHLEKTCAGTDCTVTKSNFEAIPVGTKITYSGPGMDALTATVNVQGGSVSGMCNIANLPGSCAFTAGTGTLAKVPSRVVVTQSGPNWFWDGDLRP